MKIKTFTFLTSLIASTAAVADNGTFKYIVISEKAAVSSAGSSKGYEQYLTDCISFAKENAHVKAESACSNAIKSAKRDFGPKSTVAKAYAYNNRAIVRTMANNNVGALDDFRKAASYKSLTVIEKNLNKLTSQINQIQQL